MRLRIPFLRPQPVRLSSLVNELTQLEDSERFTNFGPLERSFCEKMTALFGGGGSVTVCNATLGLMLAVRHALLRASWTEASRRRRRYAILPAFSFAAIAHAAAWNNLTPWFVDVDAETWLPSHDAVLDVLEHHHEEVAVLLPAATFGNGIDIDHYAALADRFNIPVVVDAAASIGCLDRRGRPFGAASPFPIVYSMHATKVFATAEAGLIYCADAETIEDIRKMSNFGFGTDRRVVLPGLNAKLSEVGALLCLRKLEELETLAGHRSELSADYRRLLPGWGHQTQTGQRLPYQFYPIVLPDPSVDRRLVLECLRRDHEVETAHYFSPHLAEQPFFADACQATALDVTEDISRRIISLPLHDTFTAEDVSYVASALTTAYATVKRGAAA